MLPPYSPLKLILKKTLPLTLGLFSIILVQLVDSIFIGMLGVDQLAVHGMTLPFQAALTGVQVGIGVAATAIISQAAGAKQNHKSALTATLALSFGALFMLMICLLLWGLNEHIFALFTSPEISADQLQLLEAIFNRYWPLWLLSALTVASLYLTSCIYRANEDSKMTGSMFFTASMINLILDPILIFACQMGIEGAAIATSIGYASCSLYMLFKARDKQWFSVVHVNRATWNCFYQLMRMIVPTTTNQMLPSLSAFITMMLVAQMGTDAIAFWSLLARIESFLLVFSLALTMSIPPIISRYLGEHEEGKMATLLLSSATFLLLFHLAIALLLLLGADLLIPLISSSAVIQDWLTVALWIIPFSYGPLGLCMLVVSAFNALQLPKSALGISFIRLFIFYIPAIWIGASSMSMSNTLMAATLANILAGIFAWFKLKQHITLRPPCTKLNSSYL